MARDKYYWVDTDHVLSKVKGKNADMTQKQLDTFLYDHSRKAYDKLTRQAERYQVSPKRMKGSTFSKLVENKYRSLNRDDALHYNNKETAKRAVIDSVKQQGESEINDFFKKRVRSTDNGIVNKVVEQHQKNIDSAKKSVKGEKRGVKKVGKKLRYLGGIDWKNDGVDLAKDIYKENKDKIKDAAGIGLAAGTILIGKKIIDNRKRKMDNAIQNAVKNRVRNHYDAKRQRSEEEQEKKAMVIPEDYRTKTEKNIRKIADKVLPAAAAVPTALALSAVTTAGGEILRQRKREKQRAEWEEENKDRRNNHARGYYVSNYRGGKKYKNSKPYVQSKERSRNSQDSRTVRV